MNTKQDIVFKRCGCTDEATGRQLAGAPGEMITVAVKTANDVIRVEVTDLSGPGCRNCARPATARKTDAVSGSWPGWPRGGGGGAAGGRSPGSGYRFGTELRHAACTWH